MVKSSVRELLVTMVMELSAPAEAELQTVRIPRVNIPAPEQLVFLRQYLLYIPTNWSHSPPTTNSFSFITKQYGADSKPHSRIPTREGRRA
jgi:hypothetical protein